MTKTDEIRPFRIEIPQADLEDLRSRSLMDPHGQIKHWSEYDRGGHFAAMEAPDLLTSDIRAFCRPLR